MWFDLQWHCLDCGTRLAKQTQTKPAGAESEIQKGKEQKVRMMDDQAECKLSFLGECTVFGVNVTSPFTFAFYK